MIDDRGSYGATKRPTDVADDIVAKTGNAMCPADELNGVRGTGHAPRGSGASDAAATATPIMSKTTPMTMIISSVSSESQIRRNLSTTPCDAKLLMAAINTAHSPMARAWRSANHGCFSNRPIVVSTIRERRGIFGVTGMARQAR